MALPKNHTNKKPHSALKTKQNKKTKIKKTKKNYVCRYDQRRHTDGQQVDEKVLNITNHVGNVIQNHNEISPHTC